MGTFPWGMLRGTGQARKSTTTRMNPSPETTRPPRTALVTGAGSGIGEAVARAVPGPGLARDRLGRAPRRRRAGAWRHRRRLRLGRGRRGEAAAAPPLDAVVNCAAIARLTPIHKMSREDWDTTLAINLNGAYYVSRQLYEPLRAAGGVLVQVASVNAKNTTRFRARTTPPRRARLADPGPCRGVGARDSGIRVFA